MQNTGSNARPSGHGTTLPGAADAERCIPLASALPTARLDPWLPVSSNGRTSLFGYCRWHERLGGLSWLLSTPVVETDEEQLRARTVSGRVYSLGRRVGVGELPDEEARLVYRLLTGPQTWRGDPIPHVDLFWLSAMKVSRWLGVESPARGALEELWVFLATTRAAYLAAMRAAGVRPL